MEDIVKELELNNENIFPTASSHVFTVIVHNRWLKKWLKNSDVDNTLNNVDFFLQPGESVPYPWRKLFIKVLNKKVSKVLPLPRYKLQESAAESPLTFSQLLQYVSQNNQRNLWKESYKKYCYNNSTKESAIVNLMEHNQLLSEVMSRLYGCNIIRIKNDPNKLNEYQEIIPNKHVSKSYETHSNLLAAMFILETDNNYYVIYRGHYENNLLDCLNFSPSLIDKNYGRGLFLIYQLLNVSKAMCDRGLSLGMLTLQDIYLSENLWLQILPSITNNVHCLDASLIYEQSKSKQGTPAVNAQSNQGKRGEEWCFRNDVVQLEKLCSLWVRGQISNLDYLLHLNTLAGRSANDMQAHFMVPWVTDFTSRCGKNWRDLTKSKYRLNKGDRQLDMTYDVSACSGQIPHHVADALTDITCYVYLARRTPKEVLCKYVRNKWVPAEYPASVQRVQEWTPDECIPEFYTDPTVFKSIHEDLPDLGVPSWASCAEDFITKHREALESAHVSENLHHWIDITFGYKLSGPAAIKAKNVCLSLADCHTTARKTGTVQLLWSPHPARSPRPLPPLPPRLHWTAPRDAKKAVRAESSEEVSEDETEECSTLGTHVSRLLAPHRARTRSRAGARARSLSTQGPEDSTSTSETRASSHSRHYRVQRSELGKGIIYLPKEFNPVASIQAMESLDNFKTKSFFTKAEDKEKSRETITTLNLFPMQDTKTEPDKGTDNTAFTNHMFLASYDQNYLKKFTQDAHLENVIKERKKLNTRYTTDAAVYKQFVTESRRRDMLVIGCLIVEIFLHQQMRPLRSNDKNFIERYNTCRTVLKHNFNSLPKCVSYIASLLLNVQPPSLSFKNELARKDEPMKKTVITDKGLPSPTPSQLLQPLLMQHLIPFPQSFNTLYKLLSTLHEYELTSNELSILYMYECDGVQCEKYQNVDKTKLHFSQKIAEGKIQACAVHLDVLLNQISCYNQFDVLDIFLTHYIELLRNKDTSVLAAWYLFDTVSKALGPAETRKKLLEHILKLYDDDYTMTDRLEHKVTEFDPTTVSNGVANKQKFVKLYHHIFLLQLMVRLGLECFLDKFTQHLVEAVGGYKDFDAEVGTPGHLCHSRSINKKPRYSDDNVKNALSTTNDIFSPDTSFGSEHVTTPNVEKSTVYVDDSAKERDGDNRSENELFHFETDKELPSRNSRCKSPADSVSSANSGTLDAMKTPSPSADFFSPSSSKTFFPATKNLNIIISKEENEPAETSKLLSPSIDIPNKPMFTSYLHFGDEESDVELRKKSKEYSRPFQNIPRNLSMNEEDISRAFGDDGYCKISDMSSESLIWLAHRLGPVLTCRYITRNLLKMLTLCYIGKENLSPCDGDDKDDFDEISVINSRVVGDKNAMKVIKCLTSIVAMYGEQLIIFQYLPHMGELIASCRRRLSSPLEGGVVACLQLVKYLLPYMSDVKVMEQLQDTIPKTILQPSIRLSATSRCTYPSGACARGALVRKLLEALHVIALRVGPEMTRLHLAVPALQRFFLAFDKASGKIDNWPKQEETTAEKSSESEIDLRKEGFLEICRDGSTAEWTVKDGRCIRADLPDLACTPPTRVADPTTLTAQEELLMVFDDELAYRSYTTFAKFIGVDTMERCLSNCDTIRALCLKYEQRHGISSPPNTLPEKRVQSSFSDEPISRKGIDITPTKSETIMDHISSSNSFGSNVTLVGNRIDVATDALERTDGRGQGFDVVAYKMDNGVKSNRHLRGDWLIYWEHEIGRPEKENRFNLKQIKLQTFTGHTQAVKSIYCLDNENSFMSGSKDKTVRLWSLRNQGDGNATTTCNWAYTGHKKGVVSLSFVPALRLAVSTDSVLHIWDPFMESVVSQLEHIKSPVSIVLALGGGSSALLAATTDTTLRLVDARAAKDTHELKLPLSATTFIRCICVGGGGAWAGVGLASGYVCVLDLRTGLPITQFKAHDGEVSTRHNMLASGHVCVLDLRTGLPITQFKAHDGEVLRLTAVDDHRILSSGLDQVTALWRVDDGELIAHLKGSTEPVHCLSVYYNELISGTTNNRIGVHTSLDQDASFSSTKLRSDTFKGVLTSMAVLPLNRLLLLGSDNGTISLLC